jgi:hypothetical protein
MKFIPYILALTAVIAVMAIYWDTGTLWRNQFDDSYLTYRYAVNLSEHNALVFNLGERVDAASSFLYTVVLARFYACGMKNLELVSFLLNMLALGLIAAFVYLSVLRLSGQWWAGIALGLIASLHGFTSSWACLGMDTTAFTALLVMWAFWTWIAPRKWVSFALTAALVLMRPEGGLAVPFWFVAFRDWRGLVALIVGAGCFYLAKFIYYGIWISHAFAAKGILTYYTPNPLQILLTWKAFALAAPFIAIAGCIMDKRVRWLGVFIGIFAVACLFGPRADWVRYTVPLLPIMLIAGAPTFRRWYFAPLILAVLLFQGFNSVKWMHSQAKNLAPVQEARADVGKWLEANADRSRPVLSGDIGSIAYHAPDVRFIDLIGLTSKDVLAAYRRGENLDTIVIMKNPQYIADTFTVKGKGLVYSHGNGEFVKNGKPSTIYISKLVTGVQFGKIMAIAITEL